MTVTISGTNGVSLCAAASVPSTALQSGVPSRSQLPAGTVLQVASASFATATSTTTSASWVDTGITVSITPTSSSSKVYVVATLGDCSAANGNNGLATLLVRNSTALGTQQSNQWNYTGQATTNIGSGTLQYLDSPATTSATTYKVQFKGQAGSAGWYVMRDNTQATITVMEIAA